MSAIATAQPSALDALCRHFEQSLGQHRRLQVSRSLIWGVALSTVALGVWMAVAEVDRVVHTQGRIIPSGKQQLVQHLEGGIVSKVFVKEGDTVQAGQSLIAVSDLLANSSRGEKRAHLEGLLARAARLQAEAEGTRFAAPTGVDANSPAMSNELDAFTARQAKLSQTLRVLDEQITQRRQELVEHEVRAKGLTGELDVARQQLSLVTAMHAKNAASQLELLEAKAKHERLSTQIREAEAALPRLRAGAQELQARHAEVAAQFRSEARSGLSDTRIELERLQQELGAEDDRVRRTVINAPMSGTVNKVFFNTVGGVVKPGDTLMELTPSQSNVVIEARVSPSERGAMQVGQRTVVKVAAFDYTTYGTLEGKVTEISADSLPDERGERYFRVGIDVDPASAQQFGQALTPGMTVMADAVTGQRTVLQYLLSPIRGLNSTAFRDRK
ncbi:HlyD family type I secretion periplasmic adaptor subunit [Ideonella sp.]|jgi:adhesin transport system membrane fusion protein|uniref:HlyD family type I secretion periplasmic adaptor subunit n=1 Tax=Ideonella sp. TaxID=1929293 RepID=UPI0037C0E974